MNLKKILQNLKWIHNLDSPESRVLIMFLKKLKLSFIAQVWVSLSKKK